MPVEVAHLEKSKLNDYVVTVTKKEKERVTKCADHDSEVSWQTKLRRPPLYCFLGIMTTLAMTVFSSGQRLSFDDTRTVFQDFLEPTSSPSHRPFGDVTNGGSAFSRTAPSEKIWPNDDLIVSLKEMLQSPSLALEEKVTMLPPPNVSNNDIIAMYSDEAHRSLYDELYQGNEFRILINGGSSSAGGGEVDYDEMFYVRFGQELESRFGVVTDIVNRAHGDRNSMHSALLGDTFFVPNVHLIIWEFSINDQRDGATDVRNQFILWLRKVRDVYNDKVPPVLLVYLWNKPFSTNSYGSIIADVFDLHALLGAEYGFVLGHVNLASYLDSLHLLPDDLAQNFLADSIHPNTLAHAAIRMIMTSFVSEQLDLTNHKFASESQFEWTCGDDMSVQWQIQEIFEGLLGGMSSGAFTAEVPRTTDLSMLRVLLPHKEFTNGTVDYDYQNFSTQRYGKAKAARIDRHRGVTIPCCRDGRLVFDLNKKSPITAIQFLLHDYGGVDGGILGRRQISGTDPKDSVDYGVEILINGQDYTGELVSARDWNCLLSDNLFATWIVLEDEDRYPNSVSFCSQDVSCDSSFLTLEHVVIF